MKFINAALAVVLLISIPMPALAAPDAQPSMEWDILLPFRFADGSRDCVYTERGMAISVDSIGNAYHLTECERDSTTSLLVLTKINPDGITLWERTFFCGMGQRCNAYGVAADNSGFVAVAFYDTGSSLAVKIRMEIFRTSTAEDVCSIAGQGVTFPNGFTINIGLPPATGFARQFTVFKNPANNTSIYVIGGSNGILAVIHQQPHICPQLYAQAGVSGQFAISELNRITGKIAATSNSVSSTVKLFTGATGGAGSSNVIGGADFLNLFMSNSTGSKLWSVRETTTHIELIELNSTTAATTRSAFSPIEPKVWVAGSGERNTVVNSGNGLWVDGADSIFACGQYSDPVTNHLRSFAAKYNTTQLAGMRWNVTWQHVPGTGADELAVYCTIGPDGALFVASTSLNANPTLDEVHVRKYSAAGVARVEEPTFVLVGDNATTTTTPLLGNTDAATGFRNFCLLNGFESGASKFLCGFVIVASTTLLVAAIASAISDRKATMIASGITGLCMMVFVSIPPVELWPPGVMVVLIIACAAFITWRLRDTFIQRG